jgi:hypothetical protein
LRSFSPVEAAFLGWPHALAEIIKLIADFWNRAGDSYTADERGENSFA